MDNRAVSVDHYENFPVASWWCPPALRPAVIAIYRFARTADDIADEGDAPAGERRASLARYDAALRACASGDAGREWREVFEPLALQMRVHALPLLPFEQLLSAFVQDTHDPLYADRSGLLDYCARSANPIGRLLLHLVQVRDATALRQSDAVCTALQLINFWQDLSRDLPRGRCYVTAADARSHGLPMPPPAVDSAAARALVRELSAWARTTMHEGAALVHRLPGRFGWELRFVVQGGLRVLDKIEANGFDAMVRRPSLGSLDAPLLAWRCLRMRKPRGAGSPVAPADEALR
jgi:hydroxysqualene synthase